VTESVPSRFVLKALALSGPAVTTSEVRFSKGLNVIVRPSDTGKTFIAQCINYMLGASTTPKRIPEAEGYDTVRLEIETGEGDEIALERSLDGGAFLMRREGRTTTLGEKHQAGSEDTVSHLLLSFTGLTDKKIRTNSRGVTRTLSFRDIAHLIMVGEESVITERSPILSGQLQQKTSELSVFRLLLTGADDSSLVEQDEPKVSRGKQEGRKELLIGMLEKTKEDIDAVGLEIEQEGVERALGSARQAVEAASAALGTERASASALEDERRSVWRSLRQIESRAATTAELQRRFELLQEQYASDRRRLEAVGEAGVRLAQMTEERCPVCGAVAEHHDQEHRKAHSTPEEVAAACNAEAEKIQLLDRDLSVTIATNAQELQNLEERSGHFQVLLQTAKLKLSNEMEPRISELLSRVRVADERLVRVSGLADLYARHSELAQMMEEAEKPVPRPNKLPSASLGAGEAERFSQVAEDLLRSWNFPNLDRVIFSEDDQDLVISGEERSSHGKGVRALTHAAFTLALLDFCRRESRPHPGVVVIDSPLVVYREPDAEGGRDYAVKDAVYRQVAATFKSEQVVILENEDPPEDLEGAKVIAFTGSVHGRSGFLPRLATAPSASS
jgi:hypothetical protein